MMYLELATEQIITYQDVRAKLPNTIFADGADLPELGYRVLNKVIENPPSPGMYCKVKGYFESNNEYFELLEECPIPKLEKPQVVPEAPRLSIDKKELLMKLFSMSSPGYTISDIEAKIKQAIAVKEAFKDKEGAKKVYSGLLELLFDNTIQPNSSFVKHVLGPILGFSEDNINKIFK